jgi:hypothetical protein
MSVAHVFLAVLHPKLDALGLVANHGILKKWGSLCGSRLITTRLMG